MISLLFESIEMYPVQTLAQPAGGRKQLFRDWGAKLETLNEEINGVALPCEELVKEAMETANSFTCNG